VPNWKFAPEATMFAILLALAPSAPPAADSFVILSATDEHTASKLVRFSPEFTATITTRLGEQNVQDVLSLRRAGRTLPAFPTGPHLVTASGERIVGVLMGGGGQSLRFAPTLVDFKKGESWHVPLSAASAVWFTDMPADTPPDPARYSWIEGAKNRDVFRFRNGDTARGILIGLGPEADRPALQFRPEMGEARAVTGKELAAIAFNPILTKPRKVKGPYCRVVLTDGSRLDLTRPTIEKGVLTGEATFGQAVELPVDAVLSLDVYHGKAVYLSDIKPKKVEQAGFLGVTWPYANDRTVRGTPLRLADTAGESTFDKGLGTHPKTTLTYDLGGKYRRFEASVGLDPSVGGRGQAAVRVLVDGKEQSFPALKTLAVGNPVPVRVNMTDAKELVLEVDFGPAGSVQADVNWAEARLIE
jgi:hypothetical protein